MHFEKCTGLIWILMRRNTIEGKAGSKSSGVGNVLIFGEEGEAKK